MPLPLRFFCLGLLLFSGSGASGAELIFKNGERLRGTILELGAETIRFKSDSLGELTIPRAEVEIKTEEQAVKPASVAAKPKAAKAKPREAKAKPEEAKAPKKEAKASPEPSAAEEEAARKLRDIALDGWTSLWEDNIFWATAWRHYPFKTWKNRVDFGFFFENSTRKDIRYDFGFNTEKRQAKHEAKINFSYAYRRINQNRIRNWSRGNVVYRYELGDGLFLQSNTRYQCRPEESINRELSQSVGVGYRWLDGASIRGTVTPEIGISYADIETDDGFLEVIGSFVQDFEVDVSSALKISQDLVLQYSPSDQGEFLLNFQLGLENRITKNLSLRVTYDYTYDERVATDAQRTRETTRVTVGARF